MFLRAALAIVTATSSGLLETNQLLYRNAVANRALGIILNRTGPLPPSQAPMARCGMSANAGPIAARMGGPDCLQHNGLSGCRRGGCGYAVTAVKLRCRDGTVVDGLRKFPHSDRMIVTSNQCEHPTIISQLSIANVGLVMRKIPHLVSIKRGNSIEFTYPRYQPITGRQVILDEIRHLRVGVRDGTDPK